MSFIVIFVVKLPTLSFLSEKKKKKKAWFRLKMLNEKKRGYLMLRGKNTPKMRVKKITVK